MKNVKPRRRKEKPIDAMIIRLVSPWLMPVTGVTIHFQFFGHLSPDSL